MESPDKSSASPPEASEVTRLLDRWNSGEPEALRQLMPLIVGDLRQIAAKYLAQEGHGHTLQPTALVNEVYLRLVGRRTVSWKSRAQFFAFVAGMMRRVLVDHARKQRAARRGSDVLRISLDETIMVSREDKDPDLVELDDALESLAQLDPRQARIVELRYFTGLSVPEVAEVEQISPTTVKREWRTAKMWLLRELSHSGATREKGTG